MTDLDRAAGYRTGWQDALETVLRETEDLPNRHCVTCAELLGRHDPIDRAAAIGVVRDGLNDLLTPETAGDIRPELAIWFHESEEICEHDNDPRDSWPCEIMADHLLRAFTVEPRITKKSDGTFAFEGRHFHRLAEARVRESRETSE